MKRKPTYHKLSKLPEWLTLWHCAGTTYPFPPAAALLCSAPPTHPHHVYDSWSVVWHTQNISSANAGQLKSLKLGVVVISSITNYFQQVMRAKWRVIWGSRANKDELIWGIIKLIVIEGEEQRTESRMKGMGCLFWKVLTTKLIKVYCYKQHQQAMSRATSSSSSHTITFRRQHFLLGEMNKKNAMECNFLDGQIKRQ